MTIISKVESARQAFLETTVEARRIVATVRNTAAARDELKCLREEALRTCECSYCGASFELTPSPRHIEACRKCGRQIDLMLQYKSRVLGGDPSAVRPLLDGYSTFTKHVPYALRGATGRVDDVKVALMQLDIAAANYRIEKKKSIQREAALHVMQREKEEIRSMLVQWGMEPDTAELESRVDEIYDEKHANDIV